MNEEIKQYTKSEVIDKLLKIEADRMEEDESYIYEMLYHGFKGYGTMNDSELKEYYEIIFNEKIEIIFRMQK